LENLLEKAKQTRIIWAKKKVLMYFLILNSIREDISY